MTNTLAIWIGGLILAFFALDYFVLGWGAHLIIMRNFVELINWVAFWR